MTIPENQSWSATALKLAGQPLNCHEMEYCHAMAWVRGSCGERIAIFLQMKDECIEKASFLTDGCGATLAAGSAVTELARGRTPFQARSITPQAVLKFCDGLPPDHLHCAILAVQALDKALDKLKKQ